MTGFSRAIPILRIFDTAKAEEFYLDFLGFTCTFRHRFGENFPLYMGISRSGCELHLSEHHGDASPGAHIRLGVDDVTALSKELAAKDYTNAKPGDPEQTPWGTLELTLTDPFGNRLTFFQAA